MRPVSGERLVPSAENHWPPRFKVVLCASITKSAGKLRDNSVDHLVIWGRLPSFYGNATKLAMQSSDRHRRLLQR